MVFQGSSAVEILSPQGSHPLANWMVTSRTPQQIQKSLGVTESGILKLYEREIKGSCHVLDASAKLQFPRPDLTVHLIHPFLVFQIFMPFGRSVSLDIGITDSGKSRRRLILTNSVKEVRSTPLHATIPLSNSRVLSSLKHAIDADIWMNLIIDLNGLVSTLFKNQKFFSLETINITGEGCRFRKIFTLRDSPGVQLALPKQLDFPESCKSKPIIIDLTCPSWNLVDVPTSQQKDAKNIDTMERKTGSQSEKHCNDTAPAPDQLETHIGGEKRNRRPREVYRDRNQSLIPKLKTVNANVLDQQQWLTSDDVNYETFLTTLKKEEQVDRKSKPSSFSLKEENTSFNVPLLISKENEPKSESCADFNISAEESSDGDNCYEIQNLLAGSESLVQSASKLLDDLKDRVDNVLS